MFKIKLIAIGNLKESYWRDALAEYKKRLSAFAEVTVTELKEERVPESPSPAEIEAALEREATAVLAAIPSRAFVAALCIEGKQLSSEELATTLSRVMQERGELALIIGSSHGLSPRVKAAADLKLSISRLTFPHQMMRPILLETVYRSLSILHGSKYHK